MGCCGSCVFKTGYKIFVDTCVGRYFHGRYLARYKKMYGEAHHHSKITPFICGEILIQPIPVLVNNYCYYVVDLIAKNFVLIDVGDPDAVLKNNTLKPDAILTTHKHWDHSYGNRALGQRFPSVPIFGGVDDNVPNATVKVHDGEELRFGRLVFTVVWTPGHTKGHTCYRLQGEEMGAPDSLFTGDHLMLAGCGANFECNVRTMIQSLEKLKVFPDNTLVWPGHELGLDNLQTAVFLEHDNEEAQTKLVWAVSKRAMKMCTCPSTIGEEKKYNPFLRTHDEALIRSLGVDKLVENWKQPYDPEEVAVACFKVIVSKSCDESPESVQKRKEISEWALAAAVGQDNKIIGGSVIMGKLVDRGKAPPRPKADRKLAV